MTLDPKHLIILAMVLACIPAGILMATFFPRLRDVAFFGMITGAAITDRLSVTFISHYWYRGTTRGFEVSIIDLLAISLLAGSVLWPRPGNRRVYWPASLGWMLLFFAYAVFSVAISQPKVYGIFELSKMLRGLIFFLAAAFYVRSQRELGILVLALSLVVCFEGALAMKQRMIGGLDRVPGTLEHENSLSMYICLVSPIFVAAAASSLPVFLRGLSIAAIGAAAVTSMLTVSRAGVPIFVLIMLGATAFCVSWRITPKKILATALVALCASALFFNTWDHLKERYAEASFKDEYLDDEQEGRGYYLRLAKVITKDKVKGVGLNNWSYWVSKKYGELVGRPYDNYDDLRTSEMDDKTVAKYIWAAPAHNLEALTMGELGLPGLALFVLLWIRWFQMGARFLFNRRPEDVRAARAEKIAMLADCKAGLWGLMVLVVYWLRWLFTVFRSLLNRSEREAMSRLGVGLFFGLCGIFLQSLTEWTFRQTHIYLTFNIFIGTMASLLYARRWARKQVVKAQIVQESHQLAFSEPVAIHA